MPLVGEDWTGEARGGIKCVVLDLPGWPILLKDLSPFAHPLPPSVGVDGCVGVQGDSAPSKFCNYPRNVAGVVNSAVLPALEA